MKRQLLALIALSALLIGTPLQTASAEGFGRGHGFVRKGPNLRHGFGHGLGLGFGGFGVGGYSDIFGYAELYRELNKNLPYFALHPPVYYSYPVPRTYGYSPFAYPGYVMTPDVAAPQPLDIINPHVPSDMQKAPELQQPQQQQPTDRAAAVQSEPQPLVITNPFVMPNRAVAQNN
jgi:hypothetical protein